MAATAPTPPETPPRPEAASQVSVPWERVESFIAQLAHDVRNGLNACELQLTFLGEICQDPEAGDEVKRLRGSLHAITKQLQVLRSATGSVTVYPLEYPAGEFFEDLRERLQKRHPVEAGRTAWKLALDPAHQLLADPALSIDACLELLDNAYRFSRTADSPVECEVESSGATVAFTVRSEPAAAPKIPTQQWGRQPLQSAKRGGYGLGLFRVRRIAEAQGGRLEATCLETGASRSVSVALTLPCSILATP